MERDELIQRRARILHKLSCLPRVMVSLYDNEYMTQFVLHELCHENCFNFPKAAYFVDNPDFDCLKGVAGLCRAEVSNISVNNQDEILAFMSHSPFNQEVRKVMRSSLKRRAEEEDEIARSIAKELAMMNHGHCSWQMKHENHGLLVFERFSEEDEVADDQLLNGLSLLSFCPIS